MDSPSVLSISQVTDAIRNCLTGEFADVWVNGEISGLKRPQSGHLYLSLKDDQAQLAAVIWRSTVARLRFEPQDGIQVLCHGYIDVYPQRGGYQLIVQSVQPLGVGALQLAFRQLHDRLKKEGLFDTQYKQPIPSIPRRVVVITSPSGAAIHDFLQVVNRRWPHLDILIVPVKVQGPDAATEISTAIRTCGSDFRFDPDVIVLTRGGGSIEDLWAFNEEQVVRAIFDCPTPVISAVGHEIDVTLSDLVADMRALTPSEAGEKLVPDAEKVLANLQDRQLRLQRMAVDQLANKREKLLSLGDRPVLRQPLQIVEHRIQQLDAIDSKLTEIAWRNFELTKHRLDRYFEILKLSAASCIPNARLQLRQIASSNGFRMPSRKIDRMREETRDLQCRLQTALKETQSLFQLELQMLEGKLNAFDPDQVLRRGYSLTLDADGNPLVSCQNAGPNDKIQTRLSDGRITSRVETIESEVK